MSPISPTDLANLIAQTNMKIIEQVALSLPYMVIIIATCAGVKIVLDLLFDYTMGITGRNRGR
ncbi:MAG: hypothetical protein WAZ21_02510 [Candidatus Saccharimonadales bacterium]